MAYDTNPDLAVKDGAVLRICPNSDCSSNGKKVPFFPLTDDSGQWYCTYCLEEINID